MRKSCVLLLASMAAFADDRKEEKKEEHKAPHGGVVLEVGDDVAHLELVHDAKNGKVTLYVLDGEAKEGVKIKDAPKINIMTEDGAKQIVSKAVGADDDGLASTFEATDDALKSDPLKGRIALVLGGKKYNIDLKEPGEHEHDK